MATSTSPTDPYNEFQLFMRCSICLETLSLPRTLPCLHTFCTVCLERHIDATLTSSITGHVHFKCPTCREETDLPPNGVFGFRRDFRMEQVREIVSTQSRTSRQSQVTDGAMLGLCSICSDYLGEGSISFYCIDCKKSFCELCTHIHGQIPVFGTHTIESCLPFTSTGPDSECPIHPSDMLIYICQDCAKPVCGTCVMKFHGDHMVVDKAKGLKDIISNVNFHYKTLRARKGQLSTMLSSVLENETNIRASRALMVEKIKNKSQEIIEDVYKQEKKLLQELEERVLEEQGRLGHTRRQLQNTLAEMSAAVDKTSDILSKHADVNLLEQYFDTEKDLSQCMEESMVFDMNISFFNLSFTSSAVRPRVGRLSAMNSATVTPLETNQVTNLNSSNSTGYESSSNSEPETSAATAGQYTSTSEPCPDNSVALTHAHLIAKLGKYGNLGGEFNMPRDVSFLRGADHFVVCDTNNERLQVFDSRGLLVSVIGQGQIRPWGVVCSSRGDFLITDNVDKCVKIYDQKGKLVKKLGSFLCPCGIALTSRNHIAVTDFFSTFVYIMDFTGEICKQIRYRTANDKHACGASRVDVTSVNDIIISDISNATVKAYTEQGCHLWTISDTSHLLSPQGLCITNDDVIHIADSVNHRIVQFSPNGDYLGSVTMLDHRLKEPTGLTLSGSGIMVVTRMKANQIRMYSLREST